MNSAIRFMHPKNLSIEDYSYTLPDEKIASYPLEKRDESKLLIFRDGDLSQDQYRNIADHLPPGSQLVFNNTKVIKARLLFKKSSGAIIEIFCLEPYEESHDYAIVLQQQESIKWKCMIGGASKWKQKLLQKKTIIGETEITLTATLLEKLPDAYVVQLDWNPSAYSFAEILEHAGETPLPPYIKRKAEELDNSRYQTIYSKPEGSVAAPTAGLHFTANIFKTLEQKEISALFITLHVGAGTFKPVKAERMEGHEMHAEWMEISQQFIEKLFTNISGKIICVGTTSVRTVESLYWMGVKAYLNPGIAVNDLAIQQWEVYEMLLQQNLSAEQALNSLLKYFQKNNLDKLLVQTQIIIAPGYQFRLTKGLVTNFHQPKSTLLLLVAAMAGEQWRKIYEYALANEFRFLSYGDGCLIFQS
ncbi:MAG: S-adenosylmethionine:tRNA ribosyltransferase-isomerase [Ginsengibacter sp.]